jgi:hypothetical protein
MNITQDKRNLLSGIWIFVMFNMIYADIIGQLVPGWLDKIEEYSQTFTGGTLLLFSVLLEIPIAMTLLSRILNSNAIRWAHAVAVPITIVFVVGGGNFNPHYLFFGSIEVAAMLVALRLAWRQ